MQYEKCIVSFIDILGFRDLIKNSEVSEVNKIHNAISLLKKVTRPPESDDNENPELMYDTGMLNSTYCQSTSDAVIRVAAFDRKANPQFGTRPNTDALFYELDDLLRAQVSLVEQGILVRGGISIGEVYIDRQGNNPIFGPGLVRAYELESKEAIFPRLVIDDKLLDDKLLEEFKNNPKLTQFGADDYAARELFSFLRTGDDGIVFLDYVKAAQENCKDFAGYLQFLGHHAQLIKANLENGRDRKVRRKFIWLQRYHNDVIKNWIEEFVTNNNFSKKYGVYDIADLEARLKCVIV